METAARAEAFMEQYEGLPVRWLVIDIWDGNADQCAIFENNAGLSRPMLMNGGRSTGTARSFDAEIEHYFVVGGDGIILYERNRADGAADGLPPWRPETIGAFIDQALQSLPVESRNWSSIKAFWR
jgi:hypothetical protein